MKKTTNERISLLVEGYPRKGFQVFSHLIRKGETGLCISRLHPEYVNEKYGLTDSKIFWLSGMKGENVMSPKSLSGISKVIKTEISKDNCRIVYLDGLEYLLLWNDMGKIISVLQELTVALRENGAEMLVSIDPLTFEERDMSKLWEAFCRYEVPVEIISAISQQNGEALPNDKNRINVDLLASKGLPATP